MEEWSSKNFVLNLSNFKKAGELIFSPKFSEKFSHHSKSLIDLEIYKKLTDTKDKIDNFQDWERCSRLSNAYENILKIAKSNKKLTVNRAYFKIYEILKYLNELGVVRLENIKRSLHVAEAPGAFVQGCISLIPNLEWYAQSLYDEKEIKIDDIVNIKEKWIGLESGSDGNLYKIETIDEIISKFKDRKADLITADGGFDVNFDPNSQEQLSLRLIFCECFTALNCQEKGGMFVCKLFDTFTNPTFQLIYIMMQFYDKCYIIKPRTSRYTNSERYLVCIGFVGLEGKEKVLEEMRKIVVGWAENSFCREIIKIDEELKAKMYEYNNMMANNQIKYLEGAFKCKDLSASQLSILSAKQNKLANDFCNAFGITPGPSNNKNICKHTNLQPIEESFALGLEQSSENGLNICKCTNCSKLVIN